MSEQMADSRHVRYGTFGSTRRIKRIAIVAIIVAMLGAMGYGYNRYLYPYGWSHSCDKVLMFALQQYADDHGGVYPAGEETPEASLSLLYPNYADAELLRGKTIPREVVKLRRRAPTSAARKSGNFGVLSKNAGIVCAPLEKSAESAVWHVGHQTHRLMWRVDKPIRSDTPLPNSDKSFRTCPS
jgi:hypothetical protein